jgi:hypothetical protein
MTHAAGDLEAVRMGENGTTGADVGGLEIRLRRLEDIDEIRRLYDDYGRHLDRGDFTAFASLFAVEGRLRLSRRSSAEGRAGIERVMQENFGSRPPMSVVHMIGSPSIELDDDRAKGEAMWAVFDRTEDGSPLVTMVGRHVDDLVREAGAWRFLRRRGFVDIPAGYRA